MLTKLETISFGLAIAVTRLLLKVMENSPSEVSGYERHLLSGRERSNLVISG